MLIIPVLANAFPPSSLFSCRLKGLELSVSSPPSVCRTLDQLSGSAALIIIWPHLFVLDWTSQEFHFTCCIHTHTHTEGVSTHLSDLTLPWFWGGCFVTSPLLWCHFYKSLPLSISSCYQMTFCFSLSSDKEHLHKQPGRTPFKGRCGGNNKCQIYLTWF